MIDQLFDGDGVRIKCCTGKGQKDTMTIKTILFYSSVGLQLLSDFRIQPRVFVLHIILLNVCFLMFRTVLHGVSGRPQRPDMCGPE